MAQITLPSAAIVEAVDLAMEFPGRVTHRVPATGDEVIVDRGHGQWAGTIRLSMVETGPDAKAVAAWANQMNDHRNFAEIPLGSWATEFAATTAASVSGGTVTLAAVPSGLAANDFVRSGNRLFQLTSLVAATRQATVVPEGVLASGAAITQAETIRAQLAGNAARSPSAGGFAGPWTLKIREAI